MCWRAAGADMVRCGGGRPPSSRIVGFPCKKLRKALVLDRALEVTAVRMLCKLLRRTLAVKVEQIPFGASFGKKTQTVFDGAGLT